MPARLEPEVRALVRELEAIGREGNAYTILFSYVLDGLVWRLFEQSSLVEVREITAEHPLWSGEVWALYPPRSFAPGTNTISKEGVALKVNWTEGAIPHMLPFVADFPTAWCSGRRPSLDRTRSSPATSPISSSWSEATGRESTLAIRLAPVLVLQLHLLCSSGG